MERLRELPQRLQWFKDHSLALALIILVNVGGIAYGFYYYAEQFAITPPHLWLFVPDSPLAVLWAEAALILYWFGRRSDLLDGLAFVGNVQVGLWTGYVLLAYWDHFQIFTLNLNFVLFWLHLGMVGLALLFVPDLRRGFSLRPERRWFVMGFAGGWYLVNDVVDYFFFDVYATGCALRPITVPCVASMEGLTASVTIGLTLASAAALAWFTRPRVEAEVPARQVPVRTR